MAALGGLGFITLGDVAANKGNAAADVAEVLSLENGILNFLPYREANKGKHHETQKRIKLPETYERKANQAIPRGKSLVGTDVFNCAHIESKVEVDKLILNGMSPEDKMKERWIQAQGNIISMGHKQADLFFNGSLDTDVSRVGGIFDFYSTVNSSTSAVASQVIDCGGSGSDNTSMMLLSLGLGVHGIYPKGSNFGVQSFDDGEIDIIANDTNGNPSSFRGERERFEMDHGLAIADYTRSCRAANIDVSNLSDGSGKDLFEILIAMWHRAKFVQAGQHCIAVNSTIAQWLDLQAYRKVGSGGQLSYVEIDGREQLVFRRIPIVTCDSISNAQARVV